MRQLNENIRRLGWTQVKSVEEMRTFDIDCDISWFFHFASGFSLFLDKLDLLLVVSAHLLNTEEAFKILILEMNARMSRNKISNDVEKVS